MSAIVPYYAGQATDHRGRLLADIQRWPDERLEAVHDYIQWMFPLREPSGFNPHAPLLDEETERTFRARPELQDNLRASFIRMLHLYGLEIRYGPLVEVKRAANFPLQSRNWLTLRNHNHLRITRILKSLRVLGLEKEASAFFECLTQIHHANTRTISAETFRFWRSAAGL